MWRKKRARVQGNKGEANVKIRFFVFQRFLLMIGFFDLFLCVVRLLFFPFATMSRLLCCTGLVHLFALACTVPHHIFEKLFIIELISGICTTNDPDAIFREHATRPAICCTLQLYVCVFVISCCPIKRNGKSYRDLKVGAQKKTNTKHHKFGRFGYVCHFVVHVHRINELWGKILSNLLAKLNRKPAPDIQ